jgi:HEAT repeat protein
MFYPTTQTMAVLCAAAVCVVVTLPTGTAVAQADDRPEARTLPVAEVTVTPRGARAVNAFAEIRRKGGPRVAVFSQSSVAQEKWLFSLIVPGELRHQPVSARKLIEAVAAAHDLKLVWAHDGRLAILYAGTADANIERLRKDLASTEIAVRREAAWLGGWLDDPRVVPLLVKATADSDAQVRQQATLGLFRFGVDLVVAIDGTAVSWLETCLATPEPDPASYHLMATFLTSVAVRNALPVGLRQLDGGEPVLAFIEKALVHPDYTFRSAAVAALGRVARNLPGARKEKSLAFLEKAFAEEKYSRLDVVAALGQLGDRLPDAQKGRVLALLQQALADKVPSMRRTSATALGQVGGARALALLATALVDPDSEVRLAAVVALGDLGGDNALALLDKVLADQDLKVRSAAVSALGSKGGDRVWTLLDTELVSSDGNRRQTAVEALGLAGGEKAVTRLERALGDTNNYVRAGAIRSLGEIGGEKALALLGNVLFPQDVACVGATNAPGLREPCSACAMAAGEALVALGDERAFRLLEKTMTSPRTEVRFCLSSALNEDSLRGPRIGGGSAALAFLKNALGSPDKGARSIAASALRSVGGDRARALLEKACADPEALVRRVALNSLWRQAGGQAVPFLGGLLDDPDSEVRQKAVEGLIAVGIGGEKTYSLLEKAAADTNFATRQSAVNAIGNAGREKALPFLEKTMADPRLRGVVVRSLCDVGGIKARDLILQRLVGETNEVVIHEASALLAPALSDPDVNVRLAAVRVLRGIKNIEGEKKGIIQGWIMKHLAREQDPRVRREITDLLVKNFGARLR